MNGTMSLSSSSWNLSDPNIGECLRLPYYRGSIYDWIIVINVVLIIINSISVVMSIGANTVFLVTYFKIRNLRTPHYFFLMLLAVTDISVGLVSQPLFIARKFMEMRGAHDCALWVTMRATVYYFSGISFLTLTLVSIERYYAVCKPIRHRNNVTEKRMSVVATVVWLLWLLFPVARFVFPQFYKLFGMFVGGLILLMFVINAALYFKIRGGIMERQNTSSPVIQRKISIRSLKREARLARTVAILMLVMVSAYLPTALGLAYKALAGVNTVYMFVFLPLADTMVLINSTFNPIFYCYRNEIILMEIKNFLKKKKFEMKASTTTLEHV